MSSSLLTSACFSFRSHLRLPAPGGTALASSRLPLLSSVGAAILTRTISRRAFEKHGRATLTQDMIPEIQGAFADVFEGGSDRRVSVNNQAGL